MLWAEDIDQPATNVFAIQDQVARAVADRLQVVLGGGEDTPLVAVATEDLDAYNLYLRGRAAYRHTVLLAAITLVAKLMGWF